MNKIKVLKLSAIGVMFFVFAFGFALNANAATLIIDSVTATPSTGTAPLDVSVLINISGTATGIADYKIDCTNNGTWDYTNSVNSNSNNASNVCNYATGGNYTMKYEVVRESLSAQGTTPVLVSNTPGPGACSIPSKAGRTIIEFIGDWLLKSGSTSHGPTATTLSAGTYDVTLNSFDSHSQKGGQGQTEERWYLKLYDASDTVLFESSAISDLPENDDVITEVVDTGVVIASNVTQLSVHHFTPSTPDSIYPVCAAFDLQTPPSTPDLFVSLTSIPTSGVAPLNDVDLKATVTGTATGDIDYKFDCTNDGTWEHEITNTDNPYTIANLCDYSTIGSFTAKVQAQREGLTATDTTVITTTGGGGCTSNCGNTGPSIRFDITKEARNITEGQTTFINPIEANPSDVLEFRITVKNITNTAFDLTLKDILPSELLGLTNVRLDNVVISEDLLQGIPTGTISPGVSIIVLFETTIAESNLFEIGSNDIVNTVVAFKDSTSKEANLTITVNKASVAGIATSVSTGGFNPMTFSIILTILLTLVLSYVLLARFYVKTHLLPNIFRMKSERDLEKTISNILKKENRRF